MLDSFCRLNILHKTWALTPVIKQGRQSLSDKASSSLKPDSEKSYIEQASDFVSGKLDS